MSEMSAYRMISAVRQSVMTVADAGHADWNSSVARPRPAPASRSIVEKPKLGKYDSAVVVSR